MVGERRDPGADADRQLLGIVEAHGQVRQPPPDGCQAGLRAPDAPVGPDQQELVRAEASRHDVILDLEALGEQAEHLVAGIVAVGLVEAP